MNFDRLFNILIPRLIADSIHYYLWRNKIGKVNVNFHEVFIDLIDDGRVWIKHSLLGDQSDSRYHILGGLVAFNYRQLEERYFNPDFDESFVENFKSITRIQRNHMTSKYELVNHDLYIIRGGQIVKEYIHWRLPDNY